MGSVNQTPTKRGSPPSEGVGVVLIMYASVVTSIIHSESKRKGGRGQTEGGGTSERKDTKEGGESERASFQGEVSKAVSRAPLYFAPAPKRTRHCFTCSKAQHGKGGQAPKEAASRRQL